MHRQWAHVAGKVLLNLGKIFVATFSSPPTSDLVASEGCHSVGSTQTVPKQVPTPRFLPRPVASPNPFGFLYHKIKTISPFELAPNSSLVKAHFVAGAHVGVKLEDEVGHGAWHAHFYFVQLHQRINIVTVCTLDGLGVCSAAPCTPRAP